MIEVKSMEELNGAAALMIVRVHVNTMAVASRFHKKTLHYIKGAITRLDMDWLTRGLAPEIVMHIPHLDIIGLMLNGPCPSPIGQWDRIHWLALLAQLHDEDAVWSFSVGGRFQ